MEAMELLDAYGVYLGLSLVLLLLVIFLMVIQPKDRRRSRERIRAERAELDKVLNLSSKRTRYQPSKRPTNTRHTQYDDEHGVYWRD